MPNNANVDERVVEMRIDNRQFVSGAEKTISILDKLKKALSFKNAGDGFSEVQRAADKVDLSSMAKDIESLSNRFSTMGIAGMQVIQNLTNAVTGFLTNTVKGLTIGPISEGFSKYEEIARYTSTILGATRNEFDMFGSWGIDKSFETQLDYVKNGLETLTWYADETSAAMTDMVANVSKFTNAGVQFEDAVVEMMGVTNWGYQAGAGKAEQARAMYNLSQAIASGSVRLMDWRSIENANMATIEFKESVLEAAVESETLLKTVDKAGKVTYKTLSGVEVNARNFAQTLSEGWFTGSVLQNTLLEYGEFSARLNDVLTDTGMGKYGINAADVMEWADAIAEGTESIETWHDALVEQMGNAAPTIDQLTYSIELLNDQEVELSKRAFLAGQEYKTFGDVIDATKDAASSGWMRTFQLIIGDAVEAKAVWSAVGDEFYDIFAAGASTRNSILAFWKDPSTFDTPAYRELVSGRTSLLNAFANLYEGIRTYIDPIIQAFKSVFTLFNENNIEQSAVKLLTLTKRFEAWTTKVALSDEAVEGMRIAFTKLFDILKKVLGVFKPIFKVIGAGIGYIKSLIEIFFESFSEDENGNMLFDSDGFFGMLSVVFGDIIEKIRWAWQTIKQFGENLKNLPIVGTIFNGLLTAVEWIAGSLILAKDAIVDMVSGSEEMESPLEKVEGLWDKIWGWISNVNIDTEEIRKNFGKIGEVFSTVFEGIVGDPEAFKERIKLMASKAIQGLKEALADIKLSDIFEGAKTGTMLYIALQFSQFIKSFQKAAKSFDSIKEGIESTFESLSKTIESYGKAQQATSILKIAAAVALLAVSMVALSMIPERRLASVAVTLLFFIGVLAYIAKQISKWGNYKSNNKYNLNVTVFGKIAGILIGIALVIGMAALAIAKMNKTNPTQMFYSVGAILVVLLGAVATIVILSKTLEDTKVKAFGKLIAIAAIIWATGSAISKMGNMKWDQMLSAALALSLVIIAVGGAVRLMGNSTIKSGVGSVLTLVAVLVSLYAVTGLVVLIGKYIDKNGGTSLIKSLLVLTVAGLILVGFAAIMAAIGRKGGLVKGAASLALVGIAFIAFAAALVIAVPSILLLLTGLIDMIYKVTEVPWDTFWEGSKRLLALSGLLIAFAAAAYILGAAALKIGVGMLAFGGGLLAVAVAIGILTAVLVPFGKVLIEFCNMVVENGQLLVAMVGVIILSILAALMAAKMKIAFTAVAIILSVLLVIHQYGPLILTVLATILEDLLKFLIGFIPTIVTFIFLAIITIVDGVAEAIRANSAAIEAAIENLLSAIIELFFKVAFQLLGDVIGMFWDLIMLIFEAVLDGIPFLSQGVKDKILGAVTLDKREVANTVGSWGDYLADATYEAFGGAEREAAGGAVAMAAAYEDTLLDEGASSMSGSLQSLIDTIYPGASEKFGSFGGNLGGDMFGGMLGTFKDQTQLDSITDAVLGPLDQYTNAETLGENTGVGYANGAASKEQENYDSGWLLGMANQRGYQDSLQIKSPSKVAYRLAGFFGEGLVNGLEDSVSDVTSSSDTLAIKMAEAVRNALATVQTLADEDFELHPRITPVVDMTNVDSAASSVNGLLGNNLTGRMSQVGRNMANLEAAASNMNALSESRANTSHDVYEVNIYPQPGMDEEMLADAVIVRLNSGLVRKGVALG